MSQQYKHLMQEERDAIHRGKLEGCSVREIARRLGRPASTVSREIVRNRQDHHYDAITAQRQARRRRQGRPRKLRPGQPLWNRVVMGLYRGWSPEQIAGRMRKMSAGDSSQRVSHESIYVALYALPRGELRKALLESLRQGHSSRRPRGKGRDRRGGLAN